ncbi:hypothetical protein [Nitrobacter sp.]|uniref:helix-turn-helix domain-containing protein n=1 Tax=Nitrobacter sp. TaxID=29420 RepID=UPI0029CAAF62|nr:hypothetical protein [Nitrobacter sp.]
MTESVNGNPARSTIDALSLAVDGNDLGQRRDEPVRTAAPHGLTGRELKRLRGAIRYTTLHCRRGRSELWWLTTNKRSSRELIADTWKRVGRLQKRFDLPAYSVLVFETSNGLHAHVIFIGNETIAHRLRGASFGTFVKVDRVHDAQGLERAYLAKERSPQAGFRQHGLGGRLRGSHRLEGGGDRVRLSRDLERDAVEAGVIDRWQHSNAKRSTERRSYRPRKLTSRKVLRLAGQLSLFPELERPVSRVKDYGGGIMPRAVAYETEFLRRQRGWTQAELGLRIGRRQPHVANVLRGHDPLSRSAANRLRDALLKGSTT